MRILHVIQRYWPYTGGSERHLQAYAERQSAAGDDVAVWTTDALDLEYFWDRAKSRVDRFEDHHNGVSIRRFPVQQLPGKSLGYAAVRRLLVEMAAVRLVPRSFLESVSRFAPRVPSLERALATHPSVDAVHCMNICFESMLLAAERYARRVGATFFLTPLIHLGESDQSGVRRYYTMRHQLALLARADGVLAQTAIERDFLIGHGVPAEKISIIGVGVDTPEGAYGDAARFRSTYSLDDFVCYVGTTAYDKGTVHLVEAMRRLWAAGRTERLVLAGPTMDHFTSYLAKLPMADRERIHVLGFIPEEDKRDLLAACWLMAMPSRTDSFGIVYLESWLAGRPVVGARAGGVPEVIVDGEDGLLVSFGDVPGLATAISRLLDDRALADRLGRVGQAKVLRQHTWDDVYARAAAVFAGPSSTPRAKTSTEPA